MITNPRRLLAEAQEKIVAVPAFNIDSLEMAQAVVNAAKRVERPIILQVTVETMDIWGWDFFVPILLNLLEVTPVQTALVLDHATRMISIKRALDAGFTGVMFDGSSLHLEENIALSNMVIEVARHTGAFVEGEVGHVARDGEPIQWEHLTSVDEAEAYWEKTKIDALAVAVGTKHGHYRDAQDIRIDRLEEIFQRIQIPLVLHGGSGMPTSLIPRLIKSGITKINVGTELRRAWWAGLRDAGEAKPREALESARRAVSERAEGILRLVNMLTA